MCSETAPSAPHACAQDMLLLAVAATLSLLPENNQRRQISSKLRETEAVEWTDVDAVSNNAFPDMLVVFRVGEPTASVLLHADISSVGPKAMLRLLVDGKSVSTVIVGQKEESKAGRYQSVSFHGAIANLAAGTHEARVQFLSLSNNFGVEDESSTDLMLLTGEGYLENTIFPAPFHATAGETRLVVREVANSRFASQVAPGFDAGANTQRITCAFASDSSGSYTYADDARGYSYGDSQSTASRTRNKDDDRCDYVDLFGTAVDFYPPAGTSKALITVDLGWILMCAALCPHLSRTSSYLCSCSPSAHAHVRVSFACLR